MISSDCLHHWRGDSWSFTVGDEKRSRTFLGSLTNANCGKCRKSCSPMTGPTQRLNTRKSFNKSIGKATDPRWGCATGAWWCCWPRRGLSAPSASWPSPWAPTTGSTPAGCVAPRARTTTRLSARTRRSWPTRVCGGPAAPRVGKHNSRCLPAPQLVSGWLLAFIDKIIY